MAQPTWGHGKGRGIVEGIRVVKFAIAAPTHTRDSRGRKRSGSHFRFPRASVYRRRRFLNLGRRLEIFNIELEFEYCLLGTISILKSLLLYLLRLVCDFARRVYEVLAKLPFATALATWRVEFATCSGSVRSLRETS